MPDPSMGFFFRGIIPPAEWWALSSLLALLGLTVHGVAVPALSEVGQSGAAESERTLQGNSPLLDARLLFRALSSVGVRVDLAAV